MSAQDDEGPRPLPPNGSAGTGVQGSQAALPPFQPPGRWMHLLTRRLRNFVWRRSISKIARTCKRRRLTYLSDEKMCRLEKALLHVDENEVPGHIIEAGVALGGSTIILASLMRRDRHLIAFDVFDTIPAPGLADGAKAIDRYRVIADGKATGLGGDGYYGYVSDLKQVVERNLAGAGIEVNGGRVQLVEGLFEETLRFEAGSLLSLVHIDCDWYDSVRLCLERTHAHLSPGGLVVIDDYHDYDGCRHAVDEFVDSHGAEYRVHPGANLILERVPRPPANVPAARQDRR